LAAIIVSAVIFTVDFSILKPMWRSKRKLMDDYGLIIRFR